jgi:hypothetical protein
MSGQGHEKLIAARNAILGMASQTNVLQVFVRMVKKIHLSTKSLLIKRKLVQWVSVLVILTAP